MLLQSVDNSTFTGNEVLENTIGIYAENSQNNRFTGNRLRGNYVAFRMGGSSADNVLGLTHFAANWHSVGCDAGAARAWSPGTGFCEVAALVRIDRTGGVGLAGSSRHTLR